jgi:hypothetical protein
MGLLLRHLLWVRLAVDALALGVTLLLEPYLAIE